MSHSPHSSPTLSPPVQSKKGNRLSHLHKQAIIAAVSAGMSQTEAAKQFNVHINTVNRLSSQVKQVVLGAAQAGWRPRFENLPEKCVGAIERAVLDESDSYKAAAVAQAHLKGVGIYQTEANQTNVFVSQITTLPADWTSQFVTSEHVDPVELSAKPDQERE